MAAPDLLGSGVVEEADVPGLLEPHSSEPEAHRHLFGLFTYQRKQVQRPQARAATRAGIAHRRSEEAEGPVRSGVAACSNELWDCHPILRPQAVAGKEQRSRGGA